MAEAPAAAGGSGWFVGHAATYDRAHALDPAHLFAFLQATQPAEFRKLGIANYRDNAAHIELDAALMRVIGPLLMDDTEFYKQFVQNASFKGFVTDMVTELMTR